MRFARSILGLALVLGIGGCSDMPGRSPTVTPSPLPTTAPEPSATPLPEPSATPTLEPLGAAAASALMVERCAFCHPLERIGQAGFSPADWRGIVERMAAYGARLSPDEQQQLAGYLAISYPP